MPDDVLRAKAIEIATCRDLARPWPLTRVAARQQPTRPGLPRNVTFLSCPCPPPYLLAAQTDWSGA